MINEKNLNLSTKWAKEKGISQHLAQDKQPTVLD